MIRRNANLRALFISVTLYVLLIGALLALAGDDILSVLGF